MSKLPVRVVGAEIFLDIEQCSELDGVGQCRRVELSEVDRDPDAVPSHQLQSGPGRYLGEGADVIRAGWWPISLR